MIDRLAAGITGFASKGTWRRRNNPRVHTWQASFSDVWVFGRMSHHQNVSMLIVDLLIRSSGVLDERT